MSFDEMDAFIAEHEDIVCPVCGKHDFTDIRKFNLMFKTCHRRHRGQLLHLLPPPRDRAGHLRQLCQHPAHHPPQAALRRLPGGQGLPQRDHPGQLHLPHPRVRADGVRVLLQARHRPGVVQLLEGLLRELAAEPRHQEGASAPARPRARGAGLLQPSATTDIEYALPVHRLGRAVGHCRPHQLRPEPPSGSTPARASSYFDQRDQRALHPLCHRAVSGLPTAWRWPSCARPTTRSIWPTARARTTSAPCCTCTRLWLPTSALSCPCPRSWATRPWRSATS